MPRPLGAHELAHPYLAPAAAVVSHWLGRSVFHAGAFAAGGGAWALAGPREAGKSTLLAQLARAGHTVLADDVLVLADGTAFAGPRTVDLREDAALRLAAGDAVGVAGARPRWRVDLAPSPTSLPLRGWLFLAWADAAELVRLAPGEALERILAQRALRVPADAPEAVLGLAALPAWELRRPRAWEDADATLELVAGATA